MTTQTTRRALRPAFAGALVGAFVATFVVSAALLAARPALAGFVPYVIRNSTVGDTAPTIITGPPTEFHIALGGQKGGLGSNDINGSTIGSIARLAIERLDNEGRFTPGSGPAVAPYFNLWITDGLGNYAVVANEPSNPAFQPLYNDGYDLSYADLADKTAKIYENSDKSWLPNNGIGLTFADLAGFKIQAPTVAELTAGWAGLGTGAPRELNTNVAYGVNWVFGDTLTNYVSDPTGYQVQNPLVAAVPAPGALTLFSAGLLGLAAVRRRRGRG